MQFLTEHTLIGNQLYFPVIGDTGKYEMSHETAPAGKWVAGIPHSSMMMMLLMNKNGRQLSLSENLHMHYFKGSLSKVEEKHVRIPIIPFLVRIEFQLNLPMPTSLEELIKEKFVEETTYDDYFDLIGRKYIKKEMMLPEAHKKIYRVTELGDGNVVIEERRGKRKKTPDRSPEPILAPAPAF